MEETHEDEIKASASIGSNRSLNTGEIQAVDHALRLDKKGQDSHGEYSIQKVLLG